MPVSYDSPAELFIPVLDSVSFPFPAFQQWISATADGVLEQAAAGSWGGQWAVPGAAAAQAHRHYKGTSERTFGETSLEVITQQFPALSSEGEAY